MELALSPLYWHRHWTGSIVDDDLPTMEISTGAVSTVDDLWLVLGRAWRTSRSAIQPVGSRSGADASMSKLGEAAWEPLAMEAIGIRCGLPTSRKSC